MRITYLIGNGFDLNLGLRTRYDDFYNKYKFEKKDDRQEVITLKQSINRFIDTDSSSEKQEIINWSDAELGFGKFTKAFEGQKETDDLINNCHIDFCEALAEYLAEETNRFSIDIFKSNKESITKMKDAFLRYTDGLKPNEKKQINNIVEAVEGGYIINALTFNYTDTLDLIIKTIIEERIIGHRKYRKQSLENSLSMPVHVHGSTERGMAFGVNDESQLRGNIFSESEPEIKNTLIKPLFNESMGEGIEQRGMDILNRSDLIYIYGMSLGYTDMRWWERVIKCLLDNSRAILIINDIKTPKVGLRSTEYDRYGRKKKDWFLDSFSSLDLESRKSIKERIYVTSENIFACIKDFAEETTNHTMEEA